jgi:hypothetical protein
MFGEGTPKQKFELLDALHPTLGEHALFFVALPFLSAILGLILYPLPARHAYRFWRTNQREIKNLSVKIAGDELVPKEQAQMLYSEIRELKRNRSRDLAEFTEERKALETEVVQLTSKSVKLEAEVAELRQRSKPRTFGEMFDSDESFVSYLTKTNFKLVFNSSVPEDRGSKTITFLPDGSVGDGRNKNEARWEVRSGKLVLLNVQGEAHSEFTPVPALGILVAVPEISTLAVKARQPQHLVPQLSKGLLG